MTWIERARLDPELRAFVDAEIARAGIEVAALRWQRDHDRAELATALAQRDAARKELTRLRRLLGRHPLITSEDPNAA